MLSHIEDEVMRNPGGVQLRGVSTKRIHMSVPVIPAVFLTWNSLRIAEELFTWFYGAHIRERLFGADMWEVLVEPLLEGFDLTPEELSGHASRYRLTGLEQALLVSRLAVDVEYLNRCGHRTTCQSPPCCESELKILAALSEAFKRPVIDTRAVLFARHARRRKRTREPEFNELWTRELIGESVLATLAWYFSRHDVCDGSDETFHEVSEGGRLVQFMFPVITGLGHETAGLQYCELLRSQVLRFLAFLSRPVEALATDTLFTG